jgi:hypothetical protein
MARIQDLEIRSDPFSILVRKPSAGKDRSYFVTATVRIKRSIENFNLSPNCPNDAED